MPKPSEPRYPKPWLVIWRAPRANSWDTPFPTWLDCSICEFGYRPQSINTAAKFLKKHRHCGFTP